MLKYSLTENILTDRPDDFSARTHVSKSYNKTKFIKRLLEKGTLMTETDAVAALNAIENTILEIIEEGGTLNLPLFNTSFSISGTFKGPLDNFDNSRHKLNINLSKGKLLRTAEKKVALEKTKAISPQPIIVEVKDSISGKKINNLLRMGLLKYVVIILKLLVITLRAGFGLSDITKRPKPLLSQRISPLQL